MSPQRVRTGIVAALLAMFAAPVADAEAEPFRHIDHSAFTLDPAGTFATYGAAITKLETDARIRKVSLESVVTAASPRRVGSWPLCHPTNLAAALKPSGFCWDRDDDTSASWIPQGVTGSGDADPSGTVGGRRLVAASWHYTGDDFARISIADYSKPSDGVPYHHLLLVEPYTDNSGKVNFRPPENVHADGLMWYGDKLFVATGVRLQVYSLSHIWRTSTSSGDVGLFPGGAYARWHGWALPMIGEYRTVWGPDGTWKSCASATGTAPCMNAISLAPGRDSFVTTEFYRVPGTPRGGGRVIRWPLDPSSGLPGHGKVSATEAYSSPIWHMQGGATDGTAFYLTGDCPGTPTGDPNDWICIHKALPDQAPHVLTKAPPLTQNLSYWPKTGELWGINERINTTTGKRVVFKIQTSAGRHAD